MPYTLQTDREKINPLVESLFHDVDTVILRGNDREGAVRTVLTNFIQSLDQHPADFDLEHSAPGAKAAFEFVNMRSSVGDLNYLLCTFFWKGALVAKISYTMADTVIDIMENLKSFSKKYKGTISCAIMEIYRRLLAEYEDQKIAENGDVFI